MKCPGSGNSLFLCVSGWDKQPQGCAQGGDVVEPWEISIGHVIYHLSESLSHGCRVDFTQELL